MPLWDLRDEEQVLEDDEDEDEDDGDGGEGGGGGGGDEGGGGGDDEGGGEEGGGEGDFPDVGDFGEGFETETEASSTGNWDQWSDSQGSSSDGDSSNWSDNPWDDDGDGGDDNAVARAWENDQRERERERQQEDWEREQEQERERAVQEQYQRVAEENERLAAVYRSQEADLGLAPQRANLVAQAGQNGYSEAGAVDTSTLPRVPEPEDILREPSTPGPVTDESYILQDRETGNRFTITADQLRNTHDLGRYIISPAGRPEGGIYSPTTSTAQAEQRAHPPLTPTTPGPRPAGQPREPEAPSPVSPAAVPAAQTAAAGAAAAGLPAEQVTAAAETAARIADQQTLAQQSSWTQAAFRGEYGARAEQEWQRQHQAELARNQRIYGAREPEIGAAPLGPYRDQGIPAAPDRRIGVAPPPGPGETGRYGINRPLTAVSPGAAGTAGPTSSSAAAAAANPTPSTSAGTGWTVIPNQQQVVPSRTAANLPPPTTAAQAQASVGQGVNPVTGEPIRVPDMSEYTPPTSFTPAPVRGPTEVPRPITAEEATGFYNRGVNPATGDLDIQQTPASAPAELPYDPRDIDAGPRELRPPSDYLPVPAPRPERDLFPSLPAEQPLASRGGAYSYSPLMVAGMSNEEATALQANPLPVPENRPERPPYPMGTLPSQDLDLTPVDPNSMTPFRPPNQPPAVLADQRAGPTGLTVPGTGGDPVQAALSNPRPLDALAALQLQAKGQVADEAGYQSDAYNIAHGISAMFNGTIDPVTGKGAGTWAEPYLNDVARMAWAKQEMQVGRNADPRNAPVDYIENWKDAFYGSNGDVPLVRELDQQMLDYGASRTQPGQPFNWQVAFGPNGEKGLIHQYQVTGFDCGPNAWAAILRSRGYNADPWDSLKYSVDNGYHSSRKIGPGPRDYSDAPFNGTKAFSDMLGDAGLQSERIGMNWNRVEQEVKEGRPVVLSGPSHYWLVSGVRETAERGKEFYAGATALQGHYPGEGKNPNWGWQSANRFVVEGAAPNEAVLVRGEVDPNSKAIKTLGLTPAGTTRADTRTFLSASRTGAGAGAGAAPVPAPRAAAPQSQADAAAAAPPSSGGAPSPRANLKPTFTSAEADDMRSRLLNEMPEVQFNPGDDIDTRLRKLAPALDWVEREYGVSAEVMAGMAINESGVGTNPKAVAAVQGNNLWSVARTPQDTLATGSFPSSIPGREWAKYPSVKTALARFVAMYAYPENGYKHTWQNRKDPEAFMKGLDDDHYIVDEPSFPKSDWYRNVRSGREQYRRATGKNVGQRGGVADFALETGSPDMARDTGSSYSYPESDGGGFEPSGPSPRANLKPRFTEPETFEMRDRLLQEAPDVQFDPQDDIETRMRKLIPVLDWAEREYGWSAEALAGMAYNESQLGTSPKAPAGKANNLWSSTYTPEDTQSTGPIPEGRWAAYPSVKHALARFTGMYMHPDNGYRYTAQARNDPDALLDALVKDRYINPKESSVPEWLAGIDTGRAMYRRLKGAR